MTATIASVDVALSDLLADLGYRTPEAQQLARAALIAAGLTNARKTPISTTKLVAVKDALATRFALTCARDACRTASTTSGRTVINVERPTDCTQCGGSANQSSVDRAVAALLGRHLRRLVVVGGAPSTHEELRALVRDRIAIRLAFGTDRRNSRDARADIAWADLIIVWGPTELRHRTSKLYTDGKHAHVVTCGRRGITALAETMIEAAARR